MKLSFVSIISGTSSILTSKFVKRVIAIEHYPYALSQAEYFARNNQIQNIDFRLGSVLHVSSLKKNFFFIHT